MEEYETAQGSPYHRGDSAKPGRFFPRGWNIVEPRTVHSQAHVTVQVTLRSYGSHVSKSMRRGVPARVNESNRLIATVIA